MKAKRRWKDRRDGTLIRDIDGMHYVMPLMYPNRCDNEAYMTINICVDNTEAFVRQMNRENPENRITMFIIIITAILKTIALRPQMNRFIANKNVYQRNELTAAFTVKKTFSDDGDETLARIEASYDDDIFTLANKINEQIALCKTGTDESTVLSKDDFLCVQTSYRRYSAFFRQARMDAEISDRHGSLSVFCGADQSGLDRYEYRISSSDELGHHIPVSGCR